MAKVRAEDGFIQAIARLAREAPRRTEDTDQVYEVRRVAEFEAFAKSVVEALRKHLPSELTLSDGGESFADTFLSRLNDADVVARLARTRNRANDLRHAIVDVCEAPDPDLSCPVTRQGTESLGDLLDIASRPPFAGDAVVELAITRARDDVTVIAEELAQEVVATVDVNLDLSASATIKDFEKYVGVDVGAMYLPALDELRSFATVNVYFGPVEDSPAPLKSAKADGTAEKKWRRAFQQRFSLTFGVSTGDISGRSGESTFNNNQNQATVKGDNVFLYGAGFRLNKYIRLTAGGAVFRNASDNTLNNVFFIGPSIDLTGLKFLRTLAGKNK